MDARGARRRSSSDILAEAPRGATPRYWEDVNVGDQIESITKGPIGLTDEIAFVACRCGADPRVAAHVFRCKRYQQASEWAFRDPEHTALEPVYSVHYNDYAARLQGAQAAYDVGVQRTCWQIHSLTDWMGDAGFIKHATTSTVACLPLRRGPPRRAIEAKEVDADGDHVVRMTTWANNQRGQEVMPGTAVIKLPHRGAEASKGA